MIETTTTERPREIAAIDLGSNSFHMVVAKVIDQDLQLVSKHKQRVHLASGLDKQHNLDNALKHNLSPRKFLWPNTFC